MKYSKKGFSFIELILILIFFFIILASLMPMLTRRHLTPPGKTNHGTFACYRKEDGSLHQTLIKGTKVVDNDIAVANCNFEPPKKAHYFYVQLIGGGGGGKRLLQSQIDPKSNSSYRIKGVENNNIGYIVTGCQEVLPTGTGSSSSAPAGGGCKYYSDHSKGYPLNIFSSEEEYLDLVKDYQVSLFGTGYEGRECTHNWYNSVDKENSGAKCEQGYKDGYPECHATVYDNGASYPNRVYTNGGVKTYELSCDTKAYDSANCKDCYKHDRESNHCDITSNPHSGEGCFASVIPQVPDHCTNSRVGGSGEFYSNVPLSILYNTLINSAAYRQEETEIEYNGERRSKAHDGMGQSFTWGGNNHFIHIKGGTGAVKSMVKGNNPYYAPGSDERTHNVQFCSVASTYSTIQPDIENAKCERSNEGSNPPFVCKKGSPSFNDKVFSYKTLQIGDLNLTQSQSIPYGIGGKSGQLKTLIFKELPEGLPMNPGKGGDVDQKGEDTTFGGGTSNIPEKVAYGGDPGNEVYTKEVHINPFGGENNNKYQWLEPGFWRTETTLDVIARLGGKISYESFIKFIISYRNENIRNIMMHFGQGGNGTASKTECTLGYQYNPIALLDYTGSNYKVINHIEPNKRINISPAIMSTTTCNGQYTWVPTGSGNYNPSNPNPTVGYKEGYWKDAVHIDEDATAGYSGAIVISW